MPQIRQLGYAGLLESGVDIDDVWQMARKNNDGIQDLLSVGRWAPVSVREKMWNKATGSKSLKPDALVALILFSQYVPGDDRDIFEFLALQIETAQGDSHFGECCGCRFVSARTCELAACRNGYFGTRTITAIQRARRRRSKQFQVRNGLNR